MQAHSAVIPSTPARQVTLYIPGLFAGPSAPEPLLRLLVRADQLPGRAEGDTERLFALFGITPEAGRDLPVAAVTRVADMGVIDREWWIRADPVYLELGRESLVMRAGLGLTQDESARLVAELNESLAQDGWLLKAPRPERWYLKPPAAAAITTTPLAAANGRNVHPLLPQGADYKAWHTRLNEIQILLYTSPVNAAREARGLLPANSVWFWGGGRLPQPGAEEWARVSSDDPLSLGLARLAGVPSGPVPMKSAELLAQPGDGDQLLVLGLPAPILSQADAEAWQAALERLVHDWLTPLMAAVHAGALAELTLVSDTGASFRYRRRHRWYFWRRPRPLAAYRTA
ncbi:MAG TPA: hypothetical protein VN277_06115 [Acidiferrobacterales bacterium]|nr:hypothetical protein [Acidiferrobacterales bacterium]